MLHELVNVLSGSRWLIQPKALHVLLQRAWTATTQDIVAAQARVAAMSDRASQPTLVGDVAVIEMRGPIVYKHSWLSMYFGCASIEMMQHQFRAALADPAVKTVLFRSDSPGGIVDMVPEFADEIFAARGTKPLLAVADTEMCSAAYWLCSQCDTMYGSRSSMVGCIGTYTEHADISQMCEKLGIKITLIAHPSKKVDGNEYEPLSDTARADLQTYADEVGAEFEAAVARGRGVLKPRVVEWSQMSMVPPRGKQAIALGLLDKAATFDGLIGKLTKKSQAAMRSMAAAGFVPGLVAESAAEVVDPDDGACPEGYELRDDGMCHLAPMPEAPGDEETTATTATTRQLLADRDLLESTLALLEDPRTT